MQINIISIQNGDISACMQQQKSIISFLVVKVLQFLKLQDISIFVLLG